MAGAGGTFSNFTLTYLVRFLNFTVEGSRIPVQNPSTVTFKCKKIKLNCMNSDWYCSQYLVTCCMLHVVTVNY